LNARQSALLILSDVLKNKSYLNLALKNRLRRETQNKRFITALVSATLENLYRIDYVLARFIAAKRVHTVVRNILRLGACQILFFQTVPISAAVNESVRLTEQNGKHQLKGFVNATLRNLAKNLENIVYPDAITEFEEYLHIFYSYPRWMCKKYIEDYGNVQAEALLAYRANHEITCIRLNLLRRKKAPEQFFAGIYCDDAFYIKNASSIETMPMFRKGEIAVQGEASMICVRAAGIARGDRVLDVCAAPGGKSAYAGQFAQEGSVLALDIHPHRVELIETEMKRLGVSNVTTRVVDAMCYRPEMSGRFDVVMVDAPCSALGLLYRKPDVKLFKKEEDLGKLAEMQRAILETCCRYVRPGGKLLYFTCTINRLENEENIAWFLSLHPEFLRDDDMKNDIPEKLMRRAGIGEMQLMPYIDEIDGFYMARLKRL
jgi:16S rRNA (cytosine967-C5)-methyltransferase